MKKTKFRVLLALASCVTLLTGCESDALFGLGGKWNQFADGAKGFFDNIAVKMGLKEEEEEKEEKPSEDSKPSGEEQSGEGEEGQGGEGQGGEGQGGEGGEGQGGEGGEGGEGGGGTVVPDPSISLAGLPEYLYVGDDLDLDNYVTLENATEYSVALSSDSEELASVEGHIISVFADGTLEFTVSSGSASAEASITVYSEARSAYYYGFKDVGHTYTVNLFDFDVDEESGEEFPVSLSSVFHSDSYVYQEYYDEEGELDGGIGFLTFSGKTSYIFQVSGNESTGEPEVQLGDKYPVTYLTDYYNCDVDANYYFGSKAEVKWDDKYGESLVLSETAAGYFAQELLFAPGFSVYEVDEETGEYVIDEETGKPVEIECEFNYIELFAVDMSDEEALEPDYYFYGYALGSPEGSDEHYLFSYFEFDFENIGVEYLDSYLADPANIPDETDYYSETFEGHVISDYLLSPAESSVFGPDGYVSFAAAVYDSQNNPVEQPAGSFWSNYVGYLPVGSGTMLYGKNSIWVIDEDNNPLNGFMNTESGVFSVYGLDDDETPFYAESVPSLESAWDSELGFPALFDAKNWEDSIAGVAVDDEENPTMYQFTFNPGQYNALFAALMYGIGNEGIFTFISGIEYYSGGADILTAFTSKLVIVPGSGVAQFSFQLNGSVLGSGGYTYKIVIQFRVNQSVSALVNAYEAAAAPFCVAA